jgi:hypothetical protein
VVNLVTQNHEWHLREFLHAQKSVELGFRFDETFMIFGVDEENNAGDFREIILPETSGWGMLA